MTVGFFLTAIIIPSQSIDCLRLLSYLTENCTRSDERVQEALQQYRLQSWPFEGVIAIRQQDATK